MSAVNLYLSFIGREWSIKYPFASVSDLEKVEKSIKLSVEFKI